MNNEINDDVDYNAGDNVDADTPLDDLNVSHLNNVNDNVSNWRMRMNDTSNPSLFPYNNLVRKTADNMARAEAMVNEKPLWTEKTSELERREAEDRDNEK